MYDLFTNVDEINEDNTNNSIENQGLIIAVANDSVNGVDETNQVAIEKSILEQKEVFHKLC